MATSLNSPRGKEFALVLVLSAIFTIAPFYSTFEAPIFLDKVLHWYFPEVFYDVEAMDRAPACRGPLVT